MQTEDIITEKHENIIIIMAAVRHHAAVVRRQAAIRVPAAVVVHRLIQVFPKQYMQVK